MGSYNLRQKDELRQKNPCFLSKLRCVCFPELKVELSTGKSKPPDKARCLVIYFIPSYHNFTHHRLDVNKK